MIKVKRNGTSVVFGPCRLSYTHLIERYAPAGETDGKYMTNVLIPKSESAVVEAINAAIEEAKKNAVASKWQGRLPKKIDLPLRDGDEKEDDVYMGHYYINAKCKTKPGLRDERGERYDSEEDADEAFYSGVWAYVSVTFYGYSVSGNNGIACGLNNVKKHHDDEPLGGRNSAETDFAGFDDESDEDL